MRKNATNLIERESQTTPQTKSITIKYTKYRYHFITLSQQLNPQQILAPNKKKLYICNRKKGFNHNVYEGIKKNIYKELYFIMHSLYVFDFCVGAGGHVLFELNAT